MSNSIENMREQGQSVWYDDISRRLIASGGLQDLIDIGVTGLTSNPSIFEKAVSGGVDYDDDVLRLAKLGKSPLDIYESLVIDDIRAAADILRPIYDRTCGVDGYVSLEVNPHLAHDTSGTINEARRLFASLGRPNVMIKVPATPEGIPAVRSLTADGINVNVTLTFSLNAYRNVRQAYISGLEDFDLSGGSVRQVSSVASFFISRVDFSADNQLEREIDQGDEIVSGLLGKVAIANARLAYRDFKADFGGRRFGLLLEKGARVQRPLWASTSTKSSRYSDVMYPESLIGPETVDTMPDVTLRAFLDHGKVSNTIEQGLDNAEEVIKSLQDIGISMNQITDQLLVDGVGLFANSFDMLLETIEKKSVQFLSV